jgi:FAD/FMN-containing dehydrogenase
LPRAIVDELRAIVGPKNIVTSPRALQGYADGALDNARLSTRRWKVGTPFDDSIVPALVVAPSTTEEVAAVVRACGRHGVPMVPMSGGSNLVGATVPIKGGVLVDMRRMNRVLKVDAPNLTVVCQPGVVLSELQRQLRLQGLCHGTNPGSADWATVGGAVSIGVQTMTGFKYGTVVDNLLALQAVMPDGTVIRTGPWYGSGYNLRGLFPRSEGTLGIITEVTMKVHRLPPVRESEGFLFASFEDAVGTQLELQSRELTALSTVLSSKSFARDHEALAGADPEGRFHGWLILELEGEAHEVSAAKRAIGGVVKPRQGHRINQRAMDSIGGLLTLFTRGAAKSASPSPGAGSKVRVSRHIWVPPDMILDVYRAFEGLVEKYHLEDSTALTTPTRMIVGCLVDPRDERQVDALSSFLQELGGLVRSAGGTLFGAHGVGLVNTIAFRDDCDAASLQLMRTIKLALDPKLIMNPGKALDMDSARNAAG